MYMLKCESRDESSLQQRQIQIYCFISDRQSDRWTSPSVTLAPSACIMKAQCSMSYASFWTSVIPHFTATRRTGSG